MHFSLIAMTALLLSQSVAQFASETPNTYVATAADNRLYKPEDPSTMTLALIGAGTFAVYFGARRGFRTRQTVTRREVFGAHMEPLAVTTVSSAGEAVEKPSRGAA